MVQYSFNSHSKNPIRVEETDQLLIIYTYEHRLATFIHFSVNALTITLVSLIITIIASITEIYDISIFGLYLGIVDSLVEDPAGIALSGLVYIALLILLLVILYRRIKSIIKKSRDKFYSGQQPQMLDIFKNIELKENSIIISDIIANLKPLNHRIHNCDDIIGMSRKKLSRMDIQNYNTMIIKYRFFMLFKSKGTVFIPGGTNNTIAGNYDRFEEILMRNLKLQVTDWMNDEDKMTRRGDRIMYLREDLSSSIRDGENTLISLLPKRMRYIDEKKESDEKNKGDEEEKSKFSWLYDRFDENTHILIVMSFLALIIFVIILIGSLFLSLILMAGVKVYPALYDAFIQGEYLIFFLLLIPGSILLYLYLMSLSYFSKIFQ